MSDHRVRTIRFWLPAIGLAVLGFWEPSLWLGVPLFFNACGPCNCVSSCPRCTAGTTPANVSVTISGLTNSGCSDCADLDGTYICAQQNPDVCTWRYTIDPEICGIGFVVFSISSPDPFLGTVFFNAGLADILNELTWADTPAAPPRNCNVSGLALTPNIDVSTECNNAGSTCTATAL